MTDGLSQPASAGETNVSKMNWEQELGRIEDILFPRLGMSVWERMLFYHLLRHTYALGRATSVFTIAGLAKATGASDFTIRDSVRSMHKKGCIRIDERGKSGHRITVLLPSQLDDLLRTIDVPPTIDIETIDFFTNRNYVAALLSREKGRCFYCLKEIQAATAALDHVVPQVEEGGNSYRNVVAACHGCNSDKVSTPAEQFLRTHYRRGVLSQAELQERLEAIKQLQAGTIVPEI